MLIYINDILLFIGTILKESCHSHAPNGANIQVREFMEKIKDDAKSNQV